MKTHGYTQTQNREKLRKAKRHAQEGLLNHNIEIIKAMYMYVSQAWYIIGRKERMAEKKGNMNEKGSVENQLPEKGERKMKIRKMGGKEREEKKNGAKKGRGQQERGED